VTIDYAGTCVDAPTNEAESFDSRTKWSGGYLAAEATTGTGQFATGRDGFRYDRSAPEAVVRGSFNEPVFLEGSRHSRLPINGVVDQFAANRRFAVKPKYMHPIFVRGTKSWCVSIGNY
jgi:hypothetical protein